MKLYAVYDKKAMFFDSPFCVENDVQAARAFDQAVNDPRSTFSKYPADFALYYLGEYDSGTGAVMCSDIPRIKHEAMEFVRQAPPDVDFVKSTPEVSVPAAGADDIKPKVCKSRKKGSVLNA